VLVRQPKNPLTGNGQDPKVTATLNNLKFNAKENNKDKNGLF